LKRPAHRMVAPIHSLAADARTFAGFSTTRWCRRLPRAVALPVAAPGARDFGSGPAPQSQRHEGDCRGPLPAATRGPFCSSWISLRYHRHPGGAARAATRVPCNETDAPHNLGRSPFQQPRPGVEPARRWESADIPGGPPSTCNAGPASTRVTHIRPYSDPGRASFVRDSDSGRGDSPHGGDERTSGRR
jgi:hypothetical protein